MRAGRGAGGRPPGESLAGLAEPPVPGVAQPAVEQGDRLAGSARRAGEGLGVAVVGGAGRGEDDAAVEQRGYAVLAALDVTVPQLEVAAVLLLPVLVQVDNQV